MRDSIKIKDGTELQLALDFPSGLFLPYGYGKIGALLLPVATFIKNLSEEPLAVVVKVVVAVSVFAVTEAIGLDGRDSLKK